MTTPQKITKPKTPAIDILQVDTEVTDTPPVAILDVLPGVKPEVAVQVVVEKTTIAAPVIAAPIIEAVKTEVVISELSEPKRPEVVKAPSPAELKLKSDLASKSNLRSTRVAVAYDALMSIIAKSSSTWKDNCGVVANVVSMTPGGQFINVFPLALEIPQNDFNEVEMVAQFEKLMNSFTHIYSASIVQYSWGGRLVVRGIDARPYGGKVNN